MRRRLVGSLKTLWMISPDKKAINFLAKYNESEAIAQATQCLVMAQVQDKDYWWLVIQKIKNYG